MSWWEGGFRFSSYEAHWSVPVIGGVVLVASLGTVRLWRGPSRQRSLGWLRSTGASVAGWPGRPSLYGAGVLVWLALFASVVGWDLHSFLEEVHELPTLSYLLGRVTRFHAGRAALVAGWMAAGWYIVTARRGRRARTGQMLPTGWAPGQEEGAAR